MNNPDDLIARLMPKTLMEHFSSNSRLYVRVRTLSLMLCLATFFSALSSIILVGIHVFFYPEQLHYDVVVVTITAVFAVQTWAFYRFKNYDLSGMLLSYSYFVIVLMLIIMSGGYQAQTLSLIMISPIIFFMMCGIMPGIRNAIFVALVGIVFALIDRSGTTLPNLFAAADPIITYGLVFAISVICVSACVLAYDSELQKRG